jgi:hypothetical protein
VPVRQTQQHGFLLSTLEAAHFSRRRFAQPYGIDNSCQNGVEYVPCWNCSPRI